MSGVSPIVARIRERVEKKKNDLESLSRMYDLKQTEQAKLLLEIEAVERGIAEDEALLCDAAPKVKRVKKTLGQQIGTDAKAGQA